MQVEQRHVIRNLSEAVEQSHSAIMIVGLDGRIEFVNRGLCEQIGYARNELMGRKWQDFRVAESPDQVPPDFSSLRVGAGLGVRYYTAIGPIRADVALPLVRQPGSSGYGLYVGIGQAF